MEQIIITHPDGSTMLLNSKAKVSGVTKAEQKVGLLGEDVVSLSVQSATPLEFFLGDKINVYGKAYALNQLPTPKKTGGRKFTYDLTLEGVQYDLIDAQFLMPDESIGDSLHADLAEFVALFISNANRVFPNKWVLGECPQGTEYKTLTFADNNCLEVLQNICTEYDQEFEITQSDGVVTVHIRKAGLSFPYPFSFGRGGGLYELSRQNVNSKNVVNRLFAYGGSNNLGSDYRHSRLCLAGKLKNQSYIENAASIAAFGVKENRRNFDEVFPNRYGTATAKGSTYYSFIDSTMFDLNERDDNGTKWLIDKVMAKVKFNTGNLAGYEFDVHKYDHSTKEIQLAPFTDETKLELPNKDSAAFQVDVGDEYFFIDIRLPDSYRTEAEELLQIGADKYLTENSQPQVQYSLGIDQNFLKQFEGELTVANLFAVGDYIEVVDSDLGVDKSIRITAFTRDILQPYKYTLTLADSVTKTILTRVISELKAIDKVITLNSLADPAKARRNWMATQEVLANVFDPEGNYYSEKIKPLSIETTMLAVGAKSQQFILQNTLIEPNYGGNANAVNVVGGSLVHYTIAEAIKTWAMGSTTISSLTTSTTYYIYARCEKNGGAGSIVFDTTQRTVDSHYEYYYFLMGSLSSAIADAGGSNAARLISLSYGASTINGKFITTGRIQSADGTSYIDLDEGKAVLQDAVIKGEVNADKGVMNNVVINGSIRNSFQDGEFYFDSDTDFTIGLPGLQNNNNVVITGNGGGYTVVFAVPFTPEYNGFKATIMNERFNNVSPNGLIRATAPSGKYFYENGVRSTTLTIRPFEGVDMIGFGEGNTFNEWIITNRFSTAGNLVLPLGINQPILYEGIVEHGTMMKYKSWDGGIVTAVRVPNVGEGVYQVTLPNSIGIPNYTVMLSGINYLNNPRYASLAEQQGNYFIVHTQDDASRNNGSFAFQVISTADWTIPEQ